MESEKIIPINEARAKLADLVRDAARGGTYYIVRRSRPQAVILGVDAYEALRRQTVAASPAPTAADWKDDPLEKLIGFFKGPVGNISGHVDDIVYGPRRRIPRRRSRRS